MRETINHLKNTQNLSDTHAVSFALKLQIDRLPSR